MDLQLDHLVLTVKSIPKSIQFYTTILGMKEISFEYNRKALLFGQQKINLHEVGKEIAPHALSPISGSADLCFVSNTPLNTIIQNLQKHDIEVIEGPVQRTGANSKLLSIYFRDPDGNLIELSNHQ